MLELPGKVGKLDFLSFLDQINANPLRFLGYRLLQGLILNLFWRMATISMFSRYLPALYIALTLKHGFVY